MNAFISYSHQDGQMLETLHKHLAQLKRDHLISAWTDNEILAGGEFEKVISSSLASSQLFIALLSPDYLNSKYCYEVEFAKAEEMHEQSDIIIVPVIVEPCDWQNSPFAKFKALPKDGKAVSVWENKNTAFLDVIQNFRKVIQSAGNTNQKGRTIEASSLPLSKNYRVQKDFDSIEKLEFTEKTFQEIRDYLNRYMAEIMQLDGVKARVLNETTISFECMLVNRNKREAEATLKVTTQVDRNVNSYFQSQDNQIGYTIGQQNNRSSNKSFELKFDQYHMFWQENANYSNSRNVKEYDAKEIVDAMWSEWIDAVGIM